MSTDTITLTREWLARIAVPMPGYRNELTAQRIAESVGSDRFTNLFVLSITRPDLDERRLATLADAGVALPDDAARAMETLRDTETAGLLAGAHPDRERAIRARFELEQLAVERPAIQPAVDMLCATAAWLTGDRTGANRYGSRVPGSTIAVIVGFANDRRLWPGEAEAPSVPAMPRVPSIPAMPALA